MKIKTVEEYIEVIYALQKKHGHVHTNDVALTLGVAPPSATEMVQKLADENLVDYKPYHGVTLTKDGEKMARELTKKHKTLAESFFQSASTKRCAACPSIERLWISGRWVWP